MQDQKESTDGHDYFYKRCYLKVSNDVDFDIEND